jgi:hypothetical protein
VADAVTGRWWRTLSAVLVLVAFPAVLVVLLAGLLVAEVLFALDSVEAASRWAIVIVPAVDAAVAAVAGAAGNDWRLAAALLAETDGEWHLRACAVDWLGRGGRGGGVGERAGGQAAVGAGVRTLGGCSGRAGGGGDHQEYGQPLEWAEQLAKHEQADECRDGRLQAHQHAEHLRRDAA